MCGRFTQADLDKLDETLFQLFGISSFEPRYNIAPTQDAAVIRDGPHGRSIEPIRWGLIPPWANDPKIAMRTINARAESVATKPAFKEPFRTRRCVIPASGFYEWKKSGSKKQPFFIHPVEAGHFAFAGLWDQWFSHQEGPVETFTIITTDANDALRDLHDRMPVILERDAIDAWLDPENRNAAELQNLLRPAPSTLTNFYPVSTFVNKVANEGAECVAPIEAETR
ncbi:MAG: SOS response-associated peptidase [Gemmatimonadales bacterium]